MEYGLLDSHIARQREISQAQSRPARIRIHMDITGAGETRKKIEFGTFMLEEPSFVFGVQARAKLSLGDIPLVTAIVMEYTQNSMGLYVGADMGIRVEAPILNIRTRIHMIFEGVALRSTHRLEG